MINETEVIRNKFDLISNLVIQKKSLNEIYTELNIDSYNITFESFSSLCKEVYKDKKIKKQNILKGLPTITNSNSYQEKYRLVFDNILDFLNLEIISSDEKQCLQTLFTFFIYHNKEVSDNFNKDMIFFLKEILIDLNKTKHISILNFIERVYNLFKAHSLEFYNIEEIRLSDLFIKCFNIIEQNINITNQDNLVYKMDDIISSIRENLSFVSPEHVSNFDLITNFLVNNLIEQKLYIQQQRELIIEQKEYIQMLKDILAQKK